jgi:hypothetical protein
MSVILDPAVYDRGSQTRHVDPASPIAAVSGSADDRYPISTKINSVKNDTPAVIEPLRLGVQTRSSLL